MLEIFFLVFWNKSCIRVFLQKDCSNDSCSQNCCLFTSHIISINFDFTNGKSFRSIVLDEGHELNSAGVPLAQDDVRLQNCSSVWILFAESVGTNSWVHPCGIVESFHQSYYEMVGISTWKIKVSYRVDRPLNVTLKLTTVERFFTTANLSRSYYKISRNKYRFTRRARYQISHDEYMLIATKINQFWNKCII